MRYAISYISTAQFDLHEEEVMEIMEKSNDFNNSQEITGILLYNERNFFQLIEGEKHLIEELYEKIAQDSRHKNIIKFLETTVSGPSNHGYLTDFITDTKKIDQSQLEEYLQYIQVLSPGSQKALKRVIELMVA